MPRATEFGFDCRGYLGDGLVGDHNINVNDILRCKLWDCSRTNVFNPMNACLKIEALKEG